MKISKSQKILLVKNRSFSLRATNLIILLFCATLAYSLTFVGVVVDEDNKPISQVVIQSEREIKFSNEKGRYHIKASENDSITFQKIGFLEKRILAKNLQKKTVLKLSSISLEGYKVSQKKDKISINSRKIKIDNSALALDVSDVLEESSIVNTDAGSLKGEENKISLLGHKAKHTLVIVDDIPMNKSGEAFDINSIPTETISEIEIIEGNSSAIGGNAALGGIIKITTKKDKIETNAIKFNSSANFGSFEFRNLKESILINNDKLQVQTYFDHLYAKNDYEYKYIFQNEPTTQKRNNNKRKINTFNQKYILRKYGLWTGKVTFRNTEKGLPGPTTKRDNFLHANLKAKYSELGLSWNKRFDNDIATTFYLNSSSDYSFYDNRKAKLLTSRIAGKTKYDKNTIGFKISKTFNYIETNFTSYYSQDEFRYVKVDLFDAEILSSLIQASQGVTSFSADTSFNMDFSHSKIFVRYDNVAKKDNDEDEGTNNNIYSFRIEESINVLDEICDVKAYYANGYNLPSFYDLYWKGDEQAQGNPDLDPEKSQGFGITNSLNLPLNLSFSFSYHFDRIKDMIYWYKGVGGWKPGNLSSAEIQNFVTEFSFLEYYGFSFVFNWTRTLAKDKESEQVLFNRPLTYTPSSITNLILKYEYKNLISSIDFNRKGEQYTSRYNDQKMLKPIEYINSQVSYNYSLELVKVTNFIRFNNILNKQFDVYSDNPAPGISWEVGVNFELVLEED